MSYICVFVEFSENNNEQTQEKVPQINKLYRILQFLYFLFM